MVLSAPSSAMPFSSIKAASRSRRIQSAPSIAKVTPEQRQMEISGRQS
jgi:hypothetical protein